MNKRSGPESLFECPPACLPACLAAWLLGYRAAGDSESVEECWLLLACCLPACCLPARGLIGDRRRHRSCRELRLICRLNRAVDFRLWPLLPMLLRPLRRLRLA